VFPEGWGLWVGSWFQVPRSGYDFAQVHQGGRRIAETGEAKILVIGDQPNDLSFSVDTGAAQK
jgi:hypothetical protein